MTQEEIIKILNKYQSKTPPLHDEGCIDPMDFHKIADEIVDRLKKQINYKEAYKYAMKALTHYIISSREKMVEAEKKGDKEAQEYYRLKVKFMRTAQKTIKANLELYLYLASDK